MARARGGLGLQPVVGVLTACSLLLAARPAPAAPPVPPSVRLSYVLGRGAEQCPPEAALRRGVAARLGRDPFRAEGAQLVSIRVEATRAGLAATVEVRDAAGKAVGTRTVASSRRDCAELAAAVELAVAIAIDPLSFNRPTSDRWEEPPLPADRIPPPPPFTSSPPRDEPRAEPPPAAVRRTPTSPRSARPPVVLVAAADVMAVIGALTR